MTIDLRLEPSEAVLIADLYQFTMAASFFEHGLNEPACFDLWVRRVPPSRGYLVVAGLERLLESLENFCFQPPALEYLASLELFSSDFLDFLSRLRFTGEVRAMQEGSLLFPGEPILEVRAPLIEAQLVETLALNQIATATLIASKAARCVTAAAGRRLVDFSLRRAQGVDAGLIVARSSYLAGFDGTATVLAGHRYGIPLFGTMGHSYIMAHDSERQAFANFVATFPRLATLLVDTYDTMKGVRNAVAAAHELRSRGVKLQAVRLDSGNLLEDSHRVRQLLDQEGLSDVSIFASGNLDEYRIDALVNKGAPIDAFGVGAALAVSDDMPSLDAVYKLVEYRGVPRIKTSVNKASVPGSKQVFRALSAEGTFVGDLVGLREESPETVASEFRVKHHAVEPLLTLRMSDGKRTGPIPTLAESRARCLESLKRLDQRYRDLRRPQVYPVAESAALRALMIEEKLKSERRQS